MYRYIGNKVKLTPQIIERTRELIGEKGVVADVMAGTGTVSLEYRKAGYQVYASDMMTYSYHHLVVNLLLSASPSFNRLQDEGIIAKGGNAYSSVVRYLNALNGVEGYFYNEFSPEGTPENGCKPRKYFTAENAKKIDAIRTIINEWIERDYLLAQEESLLLHTLIMAVNEVANISGTYGYFLADFKKNSLQPIMLNEVSFF